MHFSLLYVVSGLRFCCCLFLLSFSPARMHTELGYIPVSGLRHWIVLRTWASSFSLSSQGVDVFSFSGILFTCPYAYWVMILSWGIEHRHSFNIDILAYWAVWSHIDIYTTEYIFPYLVCLLRCRDCCMLVLYWVRTDRFPTIYKLHVSMFIVNTLYHGFYVLVRI